MSQGMHAAAATAVEQAVGVFEVPEVRAFGLADDELHPGGLLQLGQESP